MTPPVEEYRTIPLTQGKVAIVDAADYEWLLQWKWYAVTSPKSHLTPYVLAGVRVGPYKQRHIRMHRLIASLKDGDSRIVDHVNGNGLDNRRCNLRVATSAENGRNSRLSQRNKSGFKGVSWGVRQRKYRAAIYVNGKNKHLGFFRTAAEAHEAYKTAAVEHYGAFARFS